MKRTELYCQEDTNYKNEKYYNHFHPSEGQVRMCQDSRRPQAILRCAVEETEKSDDCYWAWWDNREEKFTITWRSRQALECCFPYGTKIEEEHGKGKVTPVKIILL